MPAECCKETWNKIPDDEPVFILMGRDLTAAAAIADWIVRAEKQGVNPDKLRRSREHLTAFNRFKAEHPDRCKMPD